MSKIATQQSGGITIIGLDPGSVVTGWGVVRECSSTLSLIECGTIRAKGDSFSERLAYIYHHLCDIISRLQPGEAAVEQVFTAKNPLSALKLGQARGVAIAACAAFTLPVKDYEPTMVKKSLVGNGRAEKPQVAFMVGQLLGQKPDSWKPDASDALGVAICHLTHRRFQRLSDLALLQQRKV